MDSVVVYGSEQVSHQNSAFKYIELLLMWRGKLNTGDLMVRMGISRQSASKAVYAPSFFNNFFLEIS